MMMLLVYYAFLILATALIVRNAYKMWQINNDFTLPIITFFMFYFTIAGAYIFPLDAYFEFKGASMGLHYLPIFDRLFKVSFDFTYVLSIAYYVFFILIFQYTYLLVVKKYIYPKQLQSKADFGINLEVVIRPWLVVALSLSLIFMSAFILRDEILYSISHGKSIYIITRSTTNKYYTWHQLANEFCVLIPYLAFSFAIVKSNKFGIRVIDKKSTIISLFISCAISSVYIAMLGNRREILSGIVVCILISVNNYRNIHLKRFVYLIVMVMVLFLSNDFLRSTIIPRQINKVFNIKGDQQLNWKNDDEFFTSDKTSAADKGKQVLSSFLFSNELFYAHFSMYGVLHREVPITYGSSFVNLAASAVPRALYPNRPLDIYNYYATQVNAAKGQIYTLHHATAWYLNFGLVGIFIGALILAFIFSFALWVQSHMFKSKSPFILLTKYLISFLLCAQIVTFITAGPEAYKALIVEGVIIPVVLLRLCLRKQNSLKDSL